MCFCSVGDDSDGDFKDCNDHLSERGRGLLNFELVV